MANFYFEAIDQNNNIVKGEKVAVSEEEITSYLKVKKLTIISVRQNKVEKTNSFKSFFTSEVSTNDKAAFARNLSTMIKSGLPITESIGVIADETKSKKFKSILTDVKYDLESGRPLSQALSKYLDVFDKIFTSLIAAGEVSGKLPEVLKSLYKLLAKNISIQTKIISAFTYPLVVLIALAIMGITMLIVVVPKILDVFTKMNIQLPFTLKILNFFSLLFVKLWFITVPLIIILAIVLVFFFKSTYGKRFGSFLMRKLPFLSKLSKSYDMARMTVTLSMLLRSGVPMTDSLHIVSDGVIDLNLKNSILDCEKQIKGGKTLSQAFISHDDDFPNMLIKITKVGEKSGKLDEVLAELGEYYDTQTDIMLKTMSDLIEPILMLFVGIIVATLILSIISPIYKLVGSFSNR